MWNLKVGKTQNETRFVKVYASRTPEIGNQISENENRQIDKWRIETWILNVPKIWKSKLGIAIRKIWKTIKLKSNERQSGMGVEHRKKRKIQTCVSVAVFPMFFDYFWIRSQILPFVFNLIICPSSICCPLLYFLFLISFRFSNMFCFFVFNFATKHFFINLLINILLHCTEGPKLKKDDSRWVEFSLITCSGP